MVSVRVWGWGKVKSVVSFLSIYLYLRSYTLGDNQHYSVKLGKTELTTVRLGITR